MGKYDASYGLLLLGNGDGTFKSVSANESGISFSGQVRDLHLLEIAQEKLLVVVKNDAPLEIMKLNTSIQLPIQ